MASPAFATTLWLMLRGALVGECRCLPQALVDYRRHDNNLGDWVFDRSESGYEGWKRRQSRVAEMYLQIADDQLRCVEVRPDIATERREKGLRLQAWLEAFGFEHRRNSGLWVECTILNYFT